MKILKMIERDIFVTEEIYFPYSKHGAFNRSDVLPTIRMKISQVTADIHEFKASFPQSCENLR